MNCSKKLHHLLLASAMVLGTNGFAQAQDITNIEQFSLYHPSISGSYLAGRGAFEDRQNDLAASYFMDALEADWGNIALLDRAFVALVSAGRVEEAEMVAKQLLSVEPQNELARITVGVVALKERRYASALKTLEGMSKDSLFGITGNVIWSWAVTDVKNGQVGVENLEPISQPGFKNFLVFQSALMADLSGDLKLAEALYDQAYEADPFVFRIVEAYARFLGNQGKFDAALDIIKRYNDRGLTHVNIETLTEMLAQKKRPGRMANNVQQGAAETLRGLSSALSREQASDISILMMRLAGFLHPKSDLITFSIADLMERADRFEVANAHYAKVGRDSPLHGEALVRTAENLQEIGDVDEAIRKLSNLANTMPDNLTAVIALGDALRRDKRYEEAAKAYDLALEMTGGERTIDWHLYYVRGIAHERDGAWEKAEQDFLQALELNPDQPQVLNYLGYSWVDQEMQLERALEMIEKAVALRPEDGYIVDSLGWAYYRLERFEEAVETLERAARLSPSDPTINDHLGDAYWQVDRKREARYQWSIALELTTEDDEELAEEIRKKLKGDFSTLKRVADLSN
ncbi:tetratricopeptide repeat protein [Maritalea mediterranea]|uniref:Tetratricopeptide repeat protein n=1 Tax=Maritalea mediterranea TaxID=2909667 RepID=A0ABS9E4X3_9HYPH|nr:tetratricopeptide repeat protein [Maritalea mediterranea]MCF4097843.1 tetratricopeptide repeat protein [Maritalea mediterranea]